MTSARDCREAHHDAEEVSRVETTSASPRAALGASATTEVDADAGAPPPRGPSSELDRSEPTATANATALNDYGDDAATGGFLAAPTVIATATPPDAGAPPDAGLTSGAEEPTDETAPLDEAREREVAEDAGASAHWTPPPMGSGAWPFVTEAPLWGASSFTFDPNAGAGAFTTEAPEWGASSFTFDPNAGAGAFTTERNIPGFAGSVWGFGNGYWAAPPPPPPE